MNQDEFTDAKWLTVTKAIEMEKNGELPMMGPQLLMLRQFEDDKLGSSLEKLMKVMAVKDSDLNTQMSFEDHLFEFGKTPEKFALKHMINFFNQYDFKSDLERPELLVHTNEALIAENQNLAILSKEFKGKKTPENMLKALGLVELSICNTDAYGTQGKIAPNPTRQLRTHRNRIFIAAGTRLILRTEVSHDLGVNMAKL